MRQAWLASLSFVPVVVWRSKMLKTQGAETEVRLLSTDELLSLVYSELRQLAAARLTAEPSGQTLQPTALVHEVYLRLTASRSESLWNSRAHFFAAAAEAMRRILIDRARAKACQKRGGDYDRIDLIDPVDSRTLSPLELIDLDNALAKLELVNARHARIVKLRFFAGLTNDQVAEALGVSVSTAENDWAYARCWLRVEMSR